MRARDTVFPNPQPQKANAVEGTGRPQLLEELFLLLSLNSRPTLRDCDYAVEINLPVFQSSSKEPCAPFILPVLAFCPLFLPVVKIGADTRLSEIVAAGPGVSLSAFRLSSLQPGALCGRKIFLQHRFMSRVTTQTRRRRKRP